MTSSHNNSCCGVWVPAPVRNCALGGDDTESVAKPSPHILSNACRSILPVPVFGNSSMKMTSRGYL